MTRCTRSTSASGRLGGLAQITVAATPATDAITRQLVLMADFDGTTRRSAGRQYAEPRSWPRSTRRFDASVGVRSRLRTRSPRSVPWFGRRAGGDPSADRSTLYCTSRSGRAPSWRRSHPRSRRTAPVGAESNAGRGRPRLGWASCEPHNVHVQCQNPANTPSWTGSDRFASFRRRV